MLFAVNVGAQRAPLQWKGDCAVRKDDRGGGDGWVAAVVVVVVVGGGGGV
jgi:hypothetical protein